MTTILDVLIFEEMKEEKAQKEKGLYAEIENVGKEEKEEEVKEDSCEINFEI